MIPHPETPMRQSLKWFGFVVAIALCGGIARANPLTDVQVFVSDGKLATSRNLYDGFFDEYETTDPGFADVPAGPPLPLGVAYSFVVAGKLWYHSGIEGQPVTVAPGNPMVRIGDEFTNVIVSQTTGPQPGLLLASSLAEPLHAHPPYSLLGTERPAGVYGLVLQITSPSFVTSAPFVVALTNDPEGTLTLEGVRYGEQQIVAAALVPEPSAVSLLATAAAAGLAWAMRRRAGAGRFRGLPYSCNKIA
jgi:hypothetical protein